MHFSATYQNTTFKRSSICQKVPSMPLACMDVSILSYWFNISLGGTSQIGQNIESTVDILAHINEKKKNPTLGDIDSILGGVTANPYNNDIISGTALKVIMLNELSENFTKEAHNAWEQEFLYYINSLTVSFKKSLSFLKLLLNCSFHPDCKFALLQPGVLVT